MAKIAVILVAAIVVGAAVGYYYFHEINPPEGFDDSLYREAAYLEMEQSVMNSGYELIPAYVQTDSGQIEGLCVCNYSQVYADETDHYSFTAGFIPTDSENTVVGDYSNYEIKSKDGSQDYSYILTFYLDKQCTQFVSEGHFFSYGINDNGSYFYKCQKLNSKYGDDGYTNELKGLADSNFSLYDYDSWRFMNYVGDMGYIDAQSLKKIDYTALVDEINTYLNKQMDMFYNVEVETYAELAKDALDYYLDTLGGTKIFGYTPEQLKQISDELDTHEFLKLTENGWEIGTEPSLSDVQRWLWGIGCIAVAACALIFAAPAAPILCGAVISAAATCFTQTFIAGQDPNLLEICIAAVTGALCGAMSSVIGGIEGIAASVITSSSIEAAQTYFTTYDLEATLKQFGVGVVVGAIVGAASTAIASSIKNVQLKMVKCSNDLGEVSISVKAVEGMREFAKKNNLPAPLMGEISEKSYKACLNAAARIDQSQDLFSNTISELIIGTEKIAGKVVRDRVSGINKVSSLTYTPFEKNLDKNGNYLYEMRYYFNNDYTEISSISLRYRNDACPGIDTIVATLDPGKNTVVKAYVVDVKAKPLEVIEGKVSHSVYSTTMYENVDLKDVLQSFSNLDFTGKTGDNGYREWNLITKTWAKEYDISAPA